MSSTLALSPQNHNFNSSRERNWSLAGESEEREQVVSSHICQFSWHSPCCSCSHKNSGQIIRFGPNEETPQRILLSVLAHGRIGICHYFMKISKGKRRGKRSWTIRRSKKVTLHRLSWAPRSTAESFCKTTPIMQHNAELERNSFAPVTLLICWNITTPHFVCSPFMSGSRLRRQEEGWGAPLVWGWGASFGAKPRHRHHRHIGTGCLGPRAPSVLVVRVLSGAVPSSKTHTVPLSSFVRRSNLMFQLCACHWMLTSDTGPRVPFEN